MEKATVASSSGHVDAGTPFVHRESCEDKETQFGVVASARTADVSNISDAHSGTPLTAVDGEVSANPPLAVASPVMGSPPSVNVDSSGTGTSARPVGTDPASSYGVVHLSGLSYATTRQQLEQFFEGFQLAEQDPIILFTYGHHRGEGFVRLKYPQDSVKAVEKLHRTRMEGRCVFLSVSTEKRLLEIIEDENRRNAHDVPFVARLRGLPFSSTEDDVLEFAKGVHGIVRVDLCRDSCGYLTGDAFLELQDKEGVEQAIRLHRQSMGHRYIEVMRSCAHDRDCMMRAARRRSCVHPQQPHGYTNWTHVNTGIASQQTHGHIHPGHGPYYYMSTPPLSSAEKNAPAPAFGSPYPMVIVPSRTPPRASSVVSTSFDPSCSPIVSSYVNSRTNTYPRQDAAGTTTALNDVAPATRQGLYVVRLRGLPYEATEASIANFLSGTPIVPGGIRLQFNRQNRFTGTAFVVLSTAAGREAALLKNGHAMGRRYIEIFYSSEREMRQLCSPPMMPMDHRAGGVSYAPFSHLGHPPPALFH